MKLDGIKLSQPFLAEILDDHKFFIAFSCGFKVKKNMPVLNVRIRVSIFNQKSNLHAHKGIINIWQ
jgi:hypothetical protein